MKQLLLLSLLVLSFVSGLKAQSPLIKITAIQRAGWNIDTTDFWINPAKIQYVKKGTNPLIGYSDAPKSDTLITYKVTQNFDTVINQSNRAFANIVKLNNITYVAGTTRDTAIQWGYNFGHFLEMKAKTYSPMPKVKTTISADYKNKAGYVRYDIGETAATVKSRIDSLVRVARDSTFY